MSKDLEKKKVVSPLAQVDEKIDQAIELHKEILNDLLSAFEKGVRAGKLLNEIRDSLPYGQFSKVIKEKFPFSRRTAYRYISVFEKQDELRKSLKGNLELNKAYQLLEPPKKTTEKEINEKPKNTIQPKTTPLKNIHLDMSEQGKEKRNEKTKRTIDSFNRKIDYAINQLSEGKTPRDLDKQKARERIEKKINKAQNALERLFKAKENLDKG